MTDGLVKTLNTDILNILSVNDWWCHQVLDYILYIARYFVFNVGQCFNNTYYMWCISVAFLWENEVSESLPVGRIKVTAKENWLLWVDLLFIHQTLNGMPQINFICGVSFILNSLCNTMYALFTVRTFHSTGAVRSIMTTFVETRARNLTRKNRFDGFWLSIDAMQEL